MKVIYIKAKDKLEFAKEINNEYKKSFGCKKRIY